MYKTVFQKYDDKFLIWTLDGSGGHNKAFESFFFWISSCCSSLTDVGVCVTRSQRLHPWNLFTFELNGVLRCWLDLLCNSFKRRLLFAFLCRMKTFVNKGESRSRKQPRPIFTRTQFRPWPTSKSHFYPQGQENFKLGHISSLCAAPLNVYIILYGWCWRRLYRFYYNRILYGFLIFSV